MGANSHRYLLLIPLSLSSSLGLASVPDSVFTSVHVSGSILVCVSILAFISLCISVPIFISLSHVSVYP